MISLCFRDDMWLTMHDGKVVGSGKTPYLSRMNAVANLRKEHLEKRRSGFPKILSETLQLYLIFKD